MTDEEEFEEWIRKGDYYDLPIADMKFVWLASRQSLREERSKKYEGGEMTEDENIDEEEYEKWCEDVWKPTPREAWIASRKALREEFKEETNE